MSGLVTAIPTAIAAFIATNLDDLVVLVLLFSAVNGMLRRRHVVVGQYLGFCALVVASLPGFFGGLILPHRWIGLLGLLPIAIGLSRLLNREENSQPEEAQPTLSDASLLASFLSPQTYTVAAVTVANGGDNIGIYVPLFANSALESLLVIIGVFFTLLGVWCYAAYKLTCQTAIAPLVTRYDNPLIPFVLIGLGAFIVLESRSLSLQAFVVACLCLMGLVKKTERSPKVTHN